jgi:hypothetical protein
MAQMGDRLFLPGGAGGADGADAFTGIGVFLGCFKVSRRARREKEGAESYFLCVVRRLPALAGQAPAHSGQIIEQKLALLCLSQAAI